MIWIDLIYNLALLVALSVISGFIDARWKKNTRTGLLLQGAVFGGVAAIGMLRPFVFAPGLIFDGRSVMISLGGLFFGPWTAATACLMTIPVRVIQGGSGTLMGVLVILVSAVIGTGAYLHLRKKPGEISSVALLLFGIIVHLAMLAMTIALPQNMIIPVLKNIGWPVMLIYPLATVLIGKILKDHATRDRLLQTLKESERQYRILFDRANDGIFLLSPDGSLLSVNESFARMHGYSADEMLPMNLKDLDTPESAGKSPERMRRLMAGEAQTFEVEHYHKDGHIFPLEVSCSLITSGNKSFFLCLHRDITERRQAEKKLHMMAEILDAAPGFVTVHDFNGRILYANQQACLMHGYTEQEFAALNLKDLNVSEGETGVPARLKLLEKNGKAAFESVHLRKDGSALPLNVTAKAITWNGAPAVLGIAIDISELKRMEKALKQRIVALTRPLEQSGSITFDDLFDRAEIQRIQDEFSDATGVTSAIFLPDGTEVTTVSNTSVFCRHVVRKTERGCANCSKSDVTLGSAFDPKGPVVYRCLSAGLWDGCVSIMVGDRHLANWTIGQVRDETLTEEQALQYAREIGADEQTFLEAFRKLPCMSGEKFRQIAQALFTLANQLSTSAYQNIQQARFIAERQKAEENLLRLSTAINQTIEAVVVTDAQGTIQYVNPAFEHITGYSKEEVLGANPHVLKSRRHEEIFYRNLWKTISSGHTWTGRFINKRKDSTLYTEDATISPVCAPNGTITNYVAVKRDITEELNKEDEYRQAQKMEAVGQLAGGIAHDFNNLLQAILGFSEILTGKLKPGTSEHQNVSEIKKAATRAADITRHLLAFSRKQPINRTRLDINTIIQDTEILLQLLLGDNIRRVFDLTQNLSSIEADSGQITQIIMNLAINARDAMPDGGRLTISTENIRLNPSDASVIPGSEPGDFVCLAVTDTGCGMSRGVKDHLFEPFFTTKDPGKGTGLGLAGVYGIVKKHNGWINVYSEEGQGTTFKVYLPIFEPGESSADQPGLSDKTDHEHILLVEDDLPVRNMVIRLLQDAGYQVSAADSAKEALSLFNHKQAGFDLLFSDIVLPEENGIELADLMREKKPELPVLLYSGYRDQRERWSDLDRKGYHFLQKPFTATGLLAAVYDTLEEARTCKKQS